MIGPSNAGDDTFCGGDAIKGPMSLVDMPHRKSPEEIAAAHKRAISDALLPVLTVLDAAKAVHGGVDNRPGLSGTPLHHAAQTGEGILRGLIDHVAHERQAQTSCLSLPSRCGDGKARPTPRWPRRPVGPRGYLNCDSLWWFVNARTRS
jgi:hypothetical protein